MVVCCTHHMARQLWITLRTCWCSLSWCLLAARWVTHRHLDMLISLCVKAMHVQVCQAPSMSQSRHGIPNSSALSLLQVTCVPTIGPHQATTAQPCAHANGQTTQNPYAPLARTNSSLLEARACDTLIQYFTRLPSLIDVIHCGNFLHRLSRARWQVGGAVSRITSQLPRQLAVFIQSKPMVGTQ